MEALDEDETGRVAMAEHVPSIVDETDEPSEDELTALNLQVDFDGPPVVPAPSLPAVVPPPRPRLHTLPMADAELQMQYAPTAPADFPSSTSVQSAAIAQPPPSVPSLTSLEVPNVETRRIDPEMLAEVLSRNSVRAAWTTPPNGSLAPVARKKPVRWERRIGISLFVLAASLVVVATTRPDLVARSVTWLESVVKVAKA